VDALEALDREGLLVRFVPEWRQVRCRPQRDPYHRFTVDRHLTEALRHIGTMLAAPDPEDAVEVVAVAQVRDRDAVRLGALWHDIGKVGEGGHVGIGARLADAILERMQVAAPTRELAGMMVAQHLLLPDTATRRDLSDENLILDVAAQARSPEGLACLYLLAKADARATGPAAWTPWRRTLVQELVAKVQRVFERGEMGAELAERLTERTDRLRELLRDRDAAEVERFVMRMPRGYLLAVSPEDAARHFDTITGPVGRDDVRIAVGGSSHPGTRELLVVAADRPGLLSWIAGSLAVAGCSIMAAQAFTTAEGVAVDVFEVAGTFEDEVSDRRWREFGATLKQVVEGRTVLASRVEAKRALYPSPGAAPVTVRVDNEASEFSTVIEVGAPDRLGLLHDIANALAELRLDVHLAKVTTYPERVLDAFYVRDALGRKIVDPAQEREIVETLRGRLG